MNAPKYNITMISAISSNMAIGNNNQLLWHLPSDLKWFKEKTKHKTVVMGRKTMESILPYTKGKPLPERENIVLTNQSNLNNGFIHLDFNSILNLSTEKEVMIIGGESLYKQFMPYANQLIITHVKKEYQADTFFPAWDRKIYKKKISFLSQENDIDLEFAIYQKII